MNYDYERPSSRVIQPPGGGSSNIFGGPDTPVNKSKDLREPSNASSNGGEAEKSQGKAKPVEKLLSQEETRLKLDSVGESEEKFKNLSLESLKSTSTDAGLVEKSDSTSEMSCHLQQGLQSSCLHNQDKEVHNCSEDSKESTKCEGLGMKKFSSIPMFDTDKRPSTAPCHSTRCNGKSNRSSVFMHSNYPENPNFRPGIRRKLNTAYKPANANTKSSLFCQDQNAPINEIKPVYRKPLSKKSTVFDKPPKQTIPTTPVSKTYQSTINEVVQPAKFLRQKRSSGVYNGSIMNGSSCDVVSDNSPPVILSSDYCVSQLKLNNGNRKDGPERNDGLILNRSSDNLIGSGQDAVHLKRQNNNRVSDNFRSDGFQAGSGVNKTPESHPPSGLWSSDAHPSLSNSGSTRASNNFQSQVFSPEPTRAPLWSSDFCRSPMRSDKKHTIVNKSLSSSIFAPYEEPVRPPRRAVSRSFSSTIFTP